MPTATPAKADALQTPLSPLPLETPTEQPTSSTGLLTYHGVTGYTGTREYEIDYAAALWQLIDVPYPHVAQLYERQRLQNRQEPECLIGLYGGPIGRSTTGQVEIGGRQWLLEARIATIMDAQAKQVQAPIVHYDTTVNDPVYGPITYFLTVYLPAPSDLNGKSQCQQQAEVVFSTFRMGDSTQMEKMVRGYWETVEGNFGPVQETKAYTYAGYGIDVAQASSVNMLWGKPPCEVNHGRLLGNQIHTIANAAETTFVFHDATHATVTFREGSTTHVKQLKKVRDDPTWACPGVYPKR